MVVYCYKHYIYSHHFKSFSLCPYIHSLSTHTDYCLNDTTVDRNSELMFAVSLTRGGNDLNIDRMLYK